MPRKTIREVRVKDLEKRRYPTKHYVSAAIDTVLYIVLLPSYSGKHSLLLILIALYTIYTSGRAY